MKRRAFIKRGLLFVPTISIFVPRLVRAERIGLRDPAFMANLKPKAAAAAALPFTETFEGTGYSNAGWTPTGTNMDPDYTTNPGAGVQSMHMNPGATGTLSRALPVASDNWWGKYMFRIVGAHMGDPRILMKTAGTNVCDIFMQSSQLSIYSRHGTAATGFGATDWAVDTWYYVWWHWAISTANNGVMEIWIATTDSKPGGKEINQTNGNGATQPDEFMISLANPADVQFDDVRFNTTDIYS